MGVLSPDEDDLRHARDILREVGEIERGLVDGREPLERRQKDRRRNYVGEKTACPECGWLVSAVLPKHIIQPDGIYLRIRTCAHCKAEYETEERATRVIKSSVEVA